MTGAVLTEAQLDTLSDDIAFLANPPRCRVYNSADLTIPNNADTPLTFDSERFDTDTMHSTSANTNRITATTAGKYLIGLSIVWANNSTGIRNVSMAVNGTTAILSETVVSLSGFSTPINVQTFYDLAAGDYVAVTGYQNSGGNLAISKAQSFSAEFWATWVSL